MHDRILHEIAIICRAQGFTGDLIPILSKPPAYMASSLQQSGIDNLTTGIIASWGDATLSEQEALMLLKSINDTGTI